MDQNTKVVRKTVEQTRTFSVAHGFHPGELPGEPLPLRVFTCTYYDAPDYLLGRRGITLRRRVEDRTAHWELTLPRSPASLTIEFPDRSLLPSPAISDVLRAHLRGQELVPIAKLRTRRSGSRVLDESRPLANVLFDSITQLEARRSVRRFSALSIEPLEGDESELSRVESALRSRGTDTEPADERPIIFQAIGLQSPLQPTHVSPTAPSVDHLKANFRAEVEAILAHDPGARLGLDSEDVHQMRVSTRRLRAILRAAKPMLAPEWVDGLRTELAWLGEVLGTVRDLDVLLEHFHTEAAALDPREHRAFERVLTSFGAERTEARAAMMEALRSDRYLKLVDRLEVDADAPQVVSPEVSLRALAAAQFKKLRRTIHDLGPEPSDAALHAARIKVKRARYTAELAEIVVGKAASRFIQRAKDVQQLLGDHQDAVVAEDRLRRLLTRSRGSRAVFAAGVIVERQRARRRAARAGLQDLWGKLEKRGRKAWS